MITEAGRPIADPDQDSDRLDGALAGKGFEPDFPRRRNYNAPVVCDETLDKRRNHVGCVFGMFEDWLRIINGQTGAPAPSRRPYALQQPTSSVYESRA